MNWRDVSANPVAPEVHNYLLSTIGSLKKGYAEDDLTLYLKKQACGKRVLDIGVVEHTLDFTKKNQWKHRQIRELASYCVGIDILKEEVLELNAQGYNVKHVDATSDEFIGEKFDLIIIGDVIEHVDNPVKLISFAKRHLTTGGHVVVSTPNPFFIGYVSRFMKEGVFIANAEHISWITPTMMAEVCSRSGMRINEYFTIKSSGLKGVKSPRQLIKRILKNLLLFARPKAADFFSPTYVYVLTAD